MEIPLENWQIAFDSQARALLVAAREAVKLMPDGGRIIAITYAPGGRTGTWQPWVAMGSAKAALESLCRYFAVALAKRRITVNAVSPGATDDSVFSTLPPEVLQMLRKWAESGWVPMRRLTTPADVGNVVALLCSEEAGFVTGSQISRFTSSSASAPCLSNQPIGRAVGRQALMVQLLAQQEDQRVGRRHRRIFPRHGMGRWTESGPSGSALGYADYWPLTVTPQTTRPRRLKPRVIIGALIVLSAALTFAFRHGIHAW